MIRTIEDKKFRKLMMISQLAAQQLFIMEDFIALSRVISEGKNPEEILNNIHMNFDSIVYNNNALISLLIDAGVLAMREAKQPEPEPPEPPPKGKPTLSIVTKETQ
jgi:hypothetical protein